MWIVDYVDTYGYRGTIYTPDPFEVMADIQDAEGFILAVGSYNV